MLEVLIVEDEASIANLIYINLSDEGYHCTCASDGKQGADLLEKNHYDLVLLDIMLPEINGYELLEYIRHIEGTPEAEGSTPLDVPVIFITAKGRVEDRIKGLKLGADDYIVKPFQVGELLARVEAVLRRYGRNEKELKLHDVTVNIESRRVMKGDEKIELTVKEFDLLVELMQNKNVALYRDRLYEKVWHEEFLGSTRTLDSHIQRLRKKLGWEEHIQTVFRIGYRLQE